MQMGLVSWCSNQKFYSKCIFTRIHSKAVWSNTTAPKTLTMPLWLLVMKSRIIWLLAISLRTLGGLSSEIKVTFMYGSDRVSVGSRSKSVAHTSETFLSCHMPGLCFSFFPTVAGCRLFVIYMYFIIYITELSFPDIYAILIAHFYYFVALLFHFTLKLTFSKTQFIDWLISGCFTGSICGGDMK